MRKKIYKRTKIFISYSHRDTKWLERLKVQLRPLERDFKLEIWDDTKIRPGSNWRNEISNAVESAKIAILLISADFLASDFIATDELPPLLKAAEDEGAMIIPVIVSPCMFIYTKSLSRFQAINDPSRPLIKMSRGEREEVFFNVAELIYHNGMTKEVSDSQGVESENMQIIEENFLDPNDWNRIIKIGDWIFDSDKHKIIGAGLFNYLISREEYGNREFNIETKLVFSNFTQHIKQDSGNVNAGIIFAWNANDTNPRYYNVLITGSQILLERIGFKGGDAFRDWEHIDNGINFSLQENVEYNFILLIKKGVLDLYLNTQMIHSFSFPDEGVVGRVGIRPWRSQMECFQFEVKEI